MDLPCPACGQPGAARVDRTNSDKKLLQDIPRLLRERQEAGLEGLVGGLAFIVINTEPEHHQGAVLELLSRTGLQVADAFEDDDRRTVVLSLEGSADILLTSRKAPSPFASLSKQPKASALPSTRVETFAFTCDDVETYCRIQRQRGIEFLGQGPVDAPGFRFAQTAPSPFTGLSTGVYEQATSKRCYRTASTRDLDWCLEKPQLPFLSHVGRLDHTASRVRAEHRDAAILEFISLTNYQFEFAIYVKSLNSITNVARLSENDFAMVFTSGIAPFVDMASSGPTERFTFNYGPRTHHLAWDTSRIDDVFAGLVDVGQEFLLDLVGSPDEGLKQTFSAMSHHTMLVNECIHRFGDFDGFFTKSNVTLLTEATKAQ